MADLPDPHHRFRRAMWGMVAFLLAFATLIIVVSRQFLFPALDAAKDATASQQQQLSAYSLLLLAVILFALLCGIVLVFRVSRYFFPRPHTPRTRTKYVDAWAESARRFDEQWNRDS